MSREVIRERRGEDMEGDREGEWGREREDKAKGEGERGKITKSEFLSLPT